MVDFVENWAAARKNRVAVQRDRFGNLLVRQRRAKPRGRKPIFVTAHMDHPAFVVTSTKAEGTRALVSLEFRGWVAPPYFRGARLEIFDRAARKAYEAVIESVDSRVDFPRKPFVTVTARLAQPSALRRITAGSIARWKLPKAEVKRDILHSHACDDVAGVAVALLAFERIVRISGLGHVSLLLTRSEEIGFVGAIGAAKSGIIPKSARLICLETPRSFPYDSPVGGGPIVRVGDKTSVFSPGLTNQISAIAADCARRDPTFKYQRKLMAGGTCEATTFAAYGFPSACLCMPLGNYHNMQDIDGVLAGRVPARIGREFISIDDALGLIDLLELVARRLDAREVSGGHRPYMERLWKRLRRVVT